MHELSKPTFWERKTNIIKLSSADLAEKVVKVKDDLDDSYRKVNVPYCP